MYELTAVSWLTFIPCNKFDVTQALAIFERDTTFTYRLLFLVISKFKSDTTQWSRRIFKMYRTSLETGADGNGIFSCSFLLERFFQHGMDCH